jgi:hypothetical protein
MVGKPTSKKALPFPNLIPLGMIGCMDQQNRFLEFVNYWTPLYRNRTRIFRADQEKENRLTHLTVHVIFV